MKLLKYIGLWCGILLLHSCSKDLGNYDYKEVNSLEITGLKEGDNPANRIYSVMFGDALSLSPTVTGSLSGTSLENLEFEWKVAGEVVGTEKNLEYRADQGYGKLKGEFSVLDKSTSMHASYNFFVDVSNPYSLGFYVLSKRENGDAALYCKSAVIEDRPFEEVLFPDLGGLGKEPMSLSGTTDWSPSGWHNVLTIAVRESSTPVMMVDSREFLPTLLYNSGSYVGGEEFHFAPTQVMSDPVNSVIYAVNNGKLHVLREGVIGLPALQNDPLDYVVGDKGLVRPYSVGRYLFSFWDERNKTLRVIDNGITNSNEYVYQRSHDNIIDPAEFINKTFVVGQYASVNGQPRQMYLMREGNKLISYALLYVGTYSPSSFEKIAEGNLPESGEIGMANYDYPSNFWFLAQGKTIYRASHLGLDFQKYITLPASSKGTIVQFEVSNGKLLIATHDESYSGDKKGSLYIYDATTMTLENSYEHSVEEVVDIHIGIGYD